MFDNDKILQEKLYFQNDNTLKNKIGTLTILTKQLNIIDNATHAMRMLKNMSDSVHGGLYQKKNTIIKTL